MPTWGGILAELKQTGEATKAPPFDKVRRKYLVELNAHTQRNTILYATKWTQPAANASPKNASSTEVSSHVLQSDLEYILALRSHRRQLEQLETLMLRSLLERVDRGAHVEPGKVRLSEVLGFEPGAERG